MVPQSHSWNEASVVVWCSVLQCVKVCCRTHCRGVTVWCHKAIREMRPVLYCVAVCCSVLQCVAVRCNVL